MLQTTGLSRRERERKELRLRILVSAQSLFLSGGESAVTLRGVAEKIEYSATAIYAHFPSKTALLDAVCEAQFAQFAQSMQRVEHSSDAVERVKNVAQRYVDFGLQNPDHYRLLMRRQISPANQSGSATGNDPITQSPGDYLQRAVFKAMAAGCFKPEYRDVSLITQTLWSCLHGLVALHSVRAQHAGIVWKPIHSVVEGCLEFLLNGMLAPAYQLPPTWQR